MYNTHGENRSTLNEQASDALLGIIRDLASELHPQSQLFRKATLDSSLDRDLGFDSLSRVELVLRIEQAFNINLPEQTLAAVETPRDLLRAIEGASSAPPRVIETGVARSLEVAESAPGETGTLLEAIEWHERTHAERPHIYIYSESDNAEEITYGALMEGARAVAAGLQAQQLQPGQTIAIMLPTGRDYFFSFFGALLAGCIPVPLYPPARPAQIEEHLRRQIGILNNAMCPVMITMPEAKPVSRLLKPHVKTLQHIVTVEELAVPQGKPVTWNARPRDIAFLQYTSGSTGNPKGVILTHANLLANIRAMGERVQVDSSDVFVSWLPLYHDMGLIGAWLGSLYFAIPLIIMSPLTFLARPQRWLWAIHHHRGTLAASPNFGYELCLHKINDADIEGLDLSSWRLAFNGAEPVSPETITQFSNRFAKYGLPPKAVTPVYGLAECSVGLALPSVDRGPLIDAVKRELFMNTGRAVPATVDDSNALRFVACGLPLAGHQIRIVDADGREVPERQQGRLEFRGPSATSGYYRNSDATQQLIHGEWLDSGDLAYVAGGDVYLTGRIKDVIIRAGRNLYPHELEEAVGSTDGIRKGCVAVFGSTDQKTGMERLIVVAETRETDSERLNELCRRINSLAVDLAGTPADDIALIPPNTIPKTSSGKLRRSTARARYESGMMTGQKKAVWWQVTRLALTGLLPQLRRIRHSLFNDLYAAYVWVIFCLMAVLVWITVACLPRTAWCWAAVRKAAKLFQLLTGTRISVKQLAPLPAGGSYVAVANHASYIDGVVLAAVLREDFSFVAKRELLDRFVTRVFLKRIDVEFVERMDTRRGVTDAKRIALAAGEGRSLVFFPEGTFTRMPGLLPFHMGAFLAAVEAGIPVVPIAIRGTRSILRADSWFPRRGTISVTIGAPIAPDGSDWAAAIRLRDAARAEILKHCGEPDLTPRDVTV